MTRNPGPRRAVAALLSVLLVAAAIPAFGFWSNFAGATEWTQVLNVAENAVAALETARTAIETANAVAELENQIQQDLDQAMGRVGALVERFDALSSDPMSLIETSQSLTWAGDFGGEPLQVLNAMAEMQDDSGNSLLTYARQDLAAADTVTRQRYAQAFQNSPGASDNWLARRERAERQLAADYLVLDSAERVVELIGSASESVDRSRQQTTLAETALAQEAHANQLTDIEVDIAVAQLTAHHAARNMLATWKLEREHREQLQEWIDALTNQGQQARRAQNRARGRGNAFSQALLLN